MKPKYTVIIVSYNSQNGLKKTVESCRNQSYEDFEIIIKDGGSSDGSTDFLKNETDERTRFYSSPDNGIYDGMNQAIDLANGQYALFMNCGDYFYSDDTLAQIDASISLDGGKADIYFGDCYVRNRGGFVYLPEQWNDFCCYRYTICHQAMIYRTDMLQKAKFDISCRISACIVHYIKAYAVDHKILTHIPVVVCNYEGGGVSDTTRGRRESLRAQYSYLSKCFGNKHLQYMMKMLFSGQLLKQLISVTPFMQPLYEYAAKLVYRRKVRK